MKVEDVSQDLKYFKDTIVRDITYAVDKDGNYQSVRSDGWDVKSDAIDIFMDEIGEECEEIKQRVKDGKTSPLEYYMAKNIMDIDLLSDYTNISKKTIKKHFDPKEFQKIDKNTLAIYAEALRIDIETLKKIPE